MYIVSQAKPPNCVTKSVLVQKVLSASTHGNGNFNFKACIAFCYIPGLYYSWNNFIRITINRSFASKLNYCFLHIVASEMIPCFFRTYGLEDEKANEVHIPV